MSRWDNTGLLWDDIAVRLERRGRGTYLREMPPIPETGWRPPQSFPNLSSARSLALDVETYDPELVDLPGAKSKGPGWGRSSGFIVGIAIGVPGGGRWYFPIRHSIMPEDNLDPNQVLAWAAYILGTPIPKIGAHITYDVGWLREEGIRVDGPLYDVQFAEALLNSETPSVSLEALAQNHLGEGKQSNELYEWCAAYYGGRPNERQRRNIWRAPPRLVGPYAESDADLPIRILERQWPQLERDDLLPVFDLECGLIRLMIDMRYTGVPIDIHYAEALSGQLKDEIIALDSQITYIAGMEVNTAAAASMAKAFDALGIPYNNTEPTVSHPQGQPSFTAPFLEEVNHPLAQLIVSKRQKEKLRTVFIESYLLKNQVNGRVHCQFHQLKGDENGARSGRFSSSEPNLQNIPVRTEEGRRIREAFIAHGVWRKFDHSQIEYRLLAHHAVGQGANQIRQRYNQHPDTDYHKEIQRLLHELARVILDRRHAKTINFGLIYGMSEAELINRLGLDDTEGKHLFKTYHKSVPFARETMHQCMEIIERTGFITTILGRRSHFNLWVPRNYKTKAIGLPLDQALREYGQVRRAYAHKALNRRLQGGAADVMKKGMLECYKAGVFDYTGIPSLTVHDELDFDDLNNNEEAFREMVHIMETCVPLSIPLKVDQKTGPNWGTTEGDD